MREFGPFAIAAEHFLVLLFKRIPVYVIIAVKRTGGRRNRLHTLLLKSRKLLGVAGSFSLQLIRVGEVSVILLVVPFASSDD